MILTPSQLTVYANLLRSIPKVGDARLLKYLHIMAKDTLMRMNEATQERVALLRLIAESSEFGMVAVVESGMDCDCVQYTGNVHIVSCKISDFWYAVEGLYERAEGPISWYVASPSAAAKICRTSRDLALEAFEDGHPHVVYS